MSEAEREVLGATEVLIPRDAVFARWAGQTPNAESGLIWAPQGMGALAYPSVPYDADYFARYIRYANTELGRKLTQARLDLVRQFYGDGHVIDVGIGCGAFVEARGGWTWGYDVNPMGVSWLKDHGRYRDPYEREFGCGTFWDVIEHIPEPGLILAQIRRWVFISCPIVPGDGPVTEDWKHYKPGEHLWYWTREGLIDWMREHGFRCRYRGIAETVLGRDDIGSFAFERV